MVSGIHKTQIMKMLGSPSEVDVDLQKFRRAARALSTSHPRMIDLYPQQWVAVHKGRVRANARSLKRLLTTVDTKKLPREEIIVRFIAKDRRTMIL